MPSRKATGAVTMSAIVMIGFYTLILNNTNGLSTKTELAISTPEPTTSSVDSNLKVAEPAGPQQPAPIQRMPLAEQRKYNNGSFTTESDFFTPSGTEGFEVTLNIKNDQIVSVSTAFSASHPHSEAINDRLFAPAISGVIEGREIDEAALRFVVNGASLHSIAFNQALENIKKEALRSVHNISFSGS